MNEDRELDQARFELIESAIGDIGRRLGRIEAVLRIGQVPEPPPKIPSFDIMPPPKSFGDPPRSIPPLPAQSEPKPSDPAPDAELQFGSVVLPRIGAGVVLLGIAYLVGLGIARHWITPMHQFIGAIALCLGFIGVGLFKRQERYDFGQVLVGIGSCGLYLACAAGHAYHHLFSGEVLVGLFTGLSFVNLGYGAVTPSRTFVGIGLLGGLVAALLPMRENHVVLSAGLNLAITLAAAGISARHKWREMSLAVWTASTSALLAPLLLPGAEWLAPIAALYATTLACGLAYAWSHEDWEFDPKAVFIPFAALVAGLIAFTRHGGVDAFWHELAFGALLALGSMLIKGKAPREALLLAGALIPFLLSPLGLPGRADTWTYLALAGVCTAMSLRFLPKALSAFAGIGLAMGIFTYAAQFGTVGSRISMGEELGLLGLMLAVSSGMAVSIGRRLGEAENATFLGLLAAAPIVCRMTMLLMGRPEVGYSGELSNALTLLVLAASGAAVAIRRGWAMLTLFSWGALFVGALLYSAEAYDRGLGMGFDLMILAGFLGATILGGGAIAKTGSKDGGAVLAAVLGWGIFSRMVFLASTLPGVGLTQNASLTLAWTLYAMAVLALGFFMNLKSLRVTGLAIFGVTVGKVLTVDMAAMDPAIRVGLLLLLGGGMIAGGYAYVRRSRTLGGPPAGPAPLIP